MNPCKYPLEVFWDEGSEAFICIASDLPGCSAVGDTPHEAVQEMETAMKLFILLIDPNLREIMMQSCLNLIILQVIDL